MSVQDEKYSQTANKNPFPGLRPYAEEEASFFYGRETEKHQLLRRLTKDRLVAVVGDVGVGKTSFVNCQIIPALRNGFIANGSSHWDIVQFRPGQKPIEALALAFFRLVVQFEGTSRIQPDLNLEFEETLRHTKYGIIDLVEKIAELAGNTNNGNGSNKTNTLIYIDHLEDIMSQGANSLEVKTFIVRLQELIQQNAYPISVIATLRTDSLRSFSKHHELLENLNRNQFPLEELGRPDLMALLSHNVNNGYIKITTDFLNHINQYYRENPINLSEFQYFMKTCVYQYQLTGDEMQPMDIPNIDDVGGLDTAMASQLDKLYDKIGSKKQRFATLIFQAITQQAKSGEISLIPRSVIEISEITNIEYQDIIEIAQLFSSNNYGVLNVYNEQDIEGRLGYLDQLIDPISMEINKILEQISGFLQDADTNLEQQRILREMHQIFDRLQTIAVENPDILDSREIQLDAEQILDQLNTNIAELEAEKDPSKRHLISDMERVSLLLDQTKNRIWNFSIITVASEVAVQEWPKLSEWMWQEQQNASLYSDLAKDVEKEEPYYEGRKFETTRDWYQKLQPHEGWARRYGFNFKAVDEFYRESELKYQGILEDKDTDEKSRLQKSRRSRNARIFMVAMALIFIGILAYTSKVTNEQVESAREARDSLSQKEKEIAELQRNADTVKHYADILIANANRANNAADSTRELSEQYAASAEANRELARNASSTLESIKKQQKDITSQLSSAKKLLSSTVSLKEYLSLLESIRQQSELARKQLENNDDPLAVRPSLNTVYEQYVLITDGMEQFEGQPFLDSTDIQDVFNITRNHLFATMNTAVHKFEEQTALNSISKPYMIGSVKGKSPNSSTVLVASTDGEFVPLLQVLEVSDDRIEKTDELKLPRDASLGFISIGSSRKFTNAMLGLRPINKDRRGLAYLNASRELKTIKHPVPPVEMYALSENEYLSIDQNSNVFLLQTDGSKVDSTKIYNGGKNNYLASDYAEVGSEKLLFLGFSDEAGANTSIIKLTFRGENKMAREDFARYAKHKVISAITFVDNKNWLVVGNRQGELFFHAATTSLPLIYEALSDHNTKGVNCITSNPIQSIVLSGGRDGIVNVWNIEDLEEALEQQKTYVPLNFDESAPIRDMLFVDDNTFLVAATDEGLDQRNGLITVLRLNFDELGGALKKLNESF
ncbi:MAG: hypothetical protein NXI20_09065 [bacterium]|nr:hypothetical protein [bacterium]